MATRRTKSTVLESATRGAAAGLVGGAVLVTAHRVFLPRLPDRKRHGTERWDKGIGAAAERIGWNLSPRARTTIGVATQLTCSALLGAMYAVVKEQLEPSRAADDFIRAGMVFTASLIAPELEPRKRRPRGLRRKAQHKALRSVTAPSMFGRATTLALRALAG